MGSVLSVLFILGIPSISSYSCPFAGFVPGNEVTGQPGNCCGNNAVVVLDNTWTSIGVYAFVNCHSLLNITIPTTVSTIGSNAFYACISLISVTFAAPSTLTLIDEDRAFAFCISLTSIVIPSSVTTIGYQAFFSCSALNSVVVEKSNIGRRSFS